MEEEVRSWAFRINRIRRGGEWKKDIPGQGQGEPEQRTGGGTRKVSKPTWLPRQSWDRDGEMAGGPFPKAGCSHLSSLLESPTLHQGSGHILFPVYGLQPLTNERLEQGVSKG